MRSARKRKQAGMQPLQEANVLARFKQWRFDWPSGDGFAAEHDDAFDEDVPDSLAETFQKFYGPAGRPRE
eukprot:6052788-Alexandrium_andersonii.AAC.1